MATGHDSGGGIGVVSRAPTRRVSAPPDGDLLCREGRQPMPTHPGTAQTRPGPGWYPDPTGPTRSAALVGRPSLVRRGAVAARPALAGSSGQPPRRTRRVIGWAAIGAFALGVSGVVIAVRRGQDVCEVSATGDRVLRARRRRSREEVEQAQPAIEEQARELESRGQRRRPTRSLRGPAPTSAARGPATTASRTSSSSSATTP